MNLDLPTTEALPETLRSSIDSQMMPTEAFARAFKLMGDQERSLESHEDHGPGAYMIYASQLSDLTRVYPELSPLDKVVQGFMDTPAFADGGYFTGTVFSRELDRHVQFLLHMMMHGEWHAYDR